MNYLHPVAEIGTANPSVASRLQSAILPTLLVGIPLASGLLFDSNRLVIAFPVLLWAALVYGGQP